MHAVVTVTLNPAIDRTVWVDRLRVGGTNRTAETRATIGGKGINVARTLARLGVPVIALGIAGEDQAPAIERHLATLGVRSRFLSTPGETRTNLKLIEGDGRLTEINGSGPEVSGELLDALERELLSVVEGQRARTVVFAGSLPPGADASLYATWTRKLHDFPGTVRVLADTSDQALALVAAARPFLVKPNRVEAEALLGHAIDGTDDACVAAQEIAGLGPRAVLLSLGRRGAVAACDGTARVLEAPAIDTASGRLLTTVGAGDAMVARIAAELARSDGIREPGPDDFYAMCRSAIDQAAEEIGRGLAVDQSSDRTPQETERGPGGADRSVVRAFGESEEPMVS